MSCRTYHLLFVELGQPFFLWFFLLTLQVLHFAIVLCGQTILALVENIPITNVCQRIRSFLLRILFELLGSNQYFLALVNRFIDHIAIFPLTSLSQIPLLLILHPKYRNSSTISKLLNAPANFYAWPIIIILSRISLPTWVYAKKCNSL